MQWLAVDIGGANLKVADGRGYAAFMPFAMWKEHGQLAQTLRTLIAQAPECDHLAITMTGELADCFENKAAGVQFILDAVVNAADSRHTRVYLSDGSLVTPQVAARRPLQAAAANWHALARFAGRFAPQESAMLLDTGSTTCDIVPLEDGVPATPNLTDTSRLLNGELVYVGVERTPICALVHEVPYREHMCPVARELFATTRDAFILLGMLREDPLDHQTADGGPATKAASRKRIGRMICADAEQFNHRDAVIAARAVSAAVAQRIAEGIHQVFARQPRQPTCCILSGHGEFAARAALQHCGLNLRQVSISDELGRYVSRCAATHALAVLAREASGP